MEVSPSITEPLKFLEDEINLGIELRDFGLPFTFDLRRIFLLMDFDLKRSYQDLSKFEAFLGHLVKGQDYTFLDLPTLIKDVELLTLEKRRLARQINQAQEVELVNKLNANHPSFVPVNEKSYVLLMQKELRGRVEYRLPGSQGLSIADLVTDTTIYEFKANLKGIADGIQQLKRYSNYLPNKTLCLYLCGDYTKEQLERAEATVLANNMAFKHLSVKEFERKSRAFHGAELRPYGTFRAALTVMAWKMNFERIAADANKECELTQAYKLAVLRTLVPEQCDLADQRTEGKKDFILSLINN